MDSKPLPLGCSIALPLLFGGLIAAPGLVLILTGFNIIDIFPEFTSGPRWVISVTGLPFFAWGVWIASHAFEVRYGEKTIVTQAIRHFLVLSFLVPLAGIFLWGGFGPGEREFQTVTTTGSQTVSGVGNELVGRCIFGGVGVVLGALALLYIYNQLIRPGKQNDPVNCKERD